MRPITQPLAAPTRSSATITQEVTDDLEAALEQFATIADDLKELQS